MNSHVDLVAQVIASDSAAANRLVEICQGLILGLARGRFGLDPDAADDLLQATFERLWERDFRALRAWRGEGKITTYVTVIATRLWLRQRSQTDQFTAHIEDVNVVEASQLRLVEDQDEKKALQVSLRMLSDRDQLLLKLRYVHDATPTEMAPLIGLTPGAIRKAVHDALARLRRVHIKERPKN